MSAGLPKMRAPAVDAFLAEAGVPERERSLDALLDRLTAREAGVDAALAARAADIQLLRDFNAAPEGALTLLQLVRATKAQNRCLLALARLAGG